MTEEVTDDETRGQEAELGLSSWQTPAYDGQGHSRSREPEPHSPPRAAPLLGESHGNVHTGNDTPQPPLRNAATGVRDALPPAQGHSGACLPAAAGTLPGAHCCPRAPPELGAWGRRGDRHPLWRPPAAGRRQGPERHRSPGGCTPPSTSGPPTPSSLQVEGTVTPTLQRHPSGTPGRSGLKWTRCPISSSQGKTWPGRGGRGSGQDGLSGHKCPDAPDGWGLGRGC